MVDICFDGPGTYAVTTRNGIDNEIMEMFSVSKATSNKMEKENVYRLSVKDQSELMGFLNALYNLQHTILKVEHLP